MPKNKKVHARWSKEEDDIVINHMLESIEKGKTLKSAFKELEQMINRTYGSIAFRWNSKLKHNQNNLSINKSESNLNHEKHIEDVFNSIDNLKKEFHDYHKLKKDYEALSNKYQTVLHKFENISKIIS